MVSRIATRWLGLFYVMSNRPPPQHVITRRCAKCHRELLPPHINKVLYAFYDLHEWSLDDVAQLARWGNLRSQRYWLSSYHPKSSSTSLIIRPLEAVRSRKEWIKWKYIDKLWAMTQVPSNRESLYPYTRYEQQVIAALRRRQWVAPKNNNPPRNLFPGILSTPTSLPTPKAILERVRRANLSVEPTPKVEALKAPDPPPVETPDHQTFSEVTFTTMTTFKNKSDDEYSEDLYGTGRPVRPDRINPEKTVEHWRLSAHGNPEVTGKLENTFAPAIHGLGVKKDQPHQADGIGILIPLNNFPVSTDVEEYGIQEETVRGEGLSILAELNLVFVGPQESSLETPVEYACVSDDVTDVESEDEKIEDLEGRLGNSECTKVAMNEEEYRMKEPQELGKGFEITEN